MQEMTDPEMTESFVTEAEENESLEDESLENEADEDETEYVESALGEAELEQALMVEDVLGHLAGTNDQTIERFRLFLMFCACIRLVSMPSQFATIADAVLGFAPLAFFVLSGFLVLADPVDRLHRIARAIKRTAIAFGILLVVYAGLNLLIYRAMGINILTDILPAFGSSRLWINFGLLNVWPLDIGSVIWYVQALLYSYIILYFLCRLKLLRFDWVIVAVLFVFALLFGEFCGILNIDLFGYQFFPPNFFNRALPYVLLGGIMARTAPGWAFRKPILPQIGLIAGVVLIIFEPVLLYLVNASGYYEHMIGMGVIAVSACFLVLQRVIHKFVDQSMGDSENEFDADEEEAELFEAEAETEAALERTEDKIEAEPEVVEAEAVEEETELTEPAFEFLEEDETEEEEERKESVLFDFQLSRWNTNLIYYLYQPLATGVGLLVVSLGQDAFADNADYLGLATFVILLVVSFLLNLIHNLRRKKKALAE